jgi:hypothetical protein
VELSYRWLQPAPDTFGLEIRKALPATYQLMSFSSADTHGVDSSGAHLIELRLRDPTQLFNSMDPSPFNDKDLDHDAEEFIVSWAREYPPDAPLTLRVHLDEWSADDPTEMIQEAVHNYFEYRAKLNRMEFKRLMEQARDSLGIGVLFMSACLLISKILLGDNPSTWAGVARESLTIAGWVAMWRPMQIYLYDWWPLRRRGRIYLKLSKMPVQVIRKEKS